MRQGFRFQQFPQVRQMWQQHRRPLLLGLIATITVLGIWESLSIQHPLPSILLLGGVLGAWTLALVLDLVNRSRRFAQQIQQLNQQLQEEILHRQQLEAELRQSQERWPLALQGSNDGIWDWQVATSAGTVIRMTGSHTDITDRKPAETALQESEARYRQLVDNLNAGFVVHAPDTRILSCNATACQLLGLTMEQMLGIKAIEPSWYFVREDKTVMPSQEYPVNQVLLTQAPLKNYVLGICQGSQSLTWVLVNAFPEWDATGALKQVVVTFIDISSLKQAEAELREMSQVMENAVSGISKLDAQGRYCYVNKTYASITGYPPEEMIGLPWQQMVHPDELAGMIETYQQMVQVGRVEVETRGLRKDGSVFYKQLVMIAAYDNNHQLVEHYCFMKDISDRKQAELALEKALLRSRALFNTSIDGIVVMNHQGNVVESSPSFAQMLGYSLEETLQLNVADWDAQWTAAELQAILNCEEFYPLFETRHRRKDGSLYDVEISYSRVDFEGEKLHFCICRDISERKQAEAVLRQSEEKFRTAIDFTYDWEYWQAVDGGFVYISPSCERITGYTPAEFIQTPNLIQTIVHPDDQTALNHHFCDQDSGVGFADFRIISRTGETRWISHTCQPVFSQDGQYLGRRVSNRDISDRKRIEAERQQTEQALRESEARFQAFMNHSPAASWIVDSRGIMVYASQTYLRTFQLPTKDLAGKSIFDLYPLPVAAQFLDNIQAVVQTGEVLQVIEVAPRPDGTLGDFLVYKFLISKSAEQALVGGVAIDVTQQHQIEEALRQSEATKQAIIQAIPDLLLRMSADGQYLDFISDNPCNLVNPGRCRQQPTNLYDLLPPNLAELGMRYTQAALQSGETQVYEHAIWVEAEPHYEEVRIVPLLDTEVLMMVRDITDRKQAEQDLRHQKEIFQAIVNHSPVMISLFDAQGRIGFINPELERVLGWSQTTWQQQDVLADCYPDPVYRQGVLEHMLSATGKWRDCTTRTASGQILETTWANVRLSNGYFLGIGQDISDRKHKEFALRQAMEAAEAANLAKSLFLANMSHELRTPLNVILGFAQVMAHDTSLSTSHQEDLQTIRRSGDHLLSLINDVLDLSKIEAGHCTLEEAGFDLIALLHALRGMLAERASSKGLRFEVNIAPTVPQFVVADEQKLRQVLLNLLSNAIKFTQRGQVALSVTLSAEPTTHLQPGYPQARLQFQVTDTGSGIAPQEVDIIFDAFVQAEAGKQSANGTGLGLTISRKLLELMGGAISVQSTPGAGSTFTFTVPVYLTSGVNIQPQQSDRIVIGLVPGQPHRRILVVDDQAENRLLMVRLLTQLGLEVREAPNGQAAVQLWREWQPDLTWMDIRMPDLDGYEATRQIRALEQEKTSIIIALTAQASQSDRTLALTAGCNDYISKPFREETLFLKMAEYLNLEYVYADSVTSQTRPLVLSAEAPEVPNAFDPSLLSRLPETWLQDLEHAAVRGDDLKITELTAQLPPEQVQLAVRLTELASHYQFEQILQLVHSRFLPAFSPSESDSHDT